MIPSLDQTNIGTLLLWTTYILLVLIGLFLKRSRAYGIAVILFLGMVAWLNTDSADLIGVYIPMYQSPQLVQHAEPGWMLLCSVGHVLGLTYNGFACIVTIVASAMVVYFAYKTTPNYSFFMALFLVYPGLISLVQFRQFVAMAIAMMGVLALAENRKHSWLVFFMIMLAAYTIHRTALIMSLIAIVPIYQKIPKWLKVVLIAVITLSIMLIISNIRAVGNFFFGDVKTSAYLRATTGDFSSGTGGNASSIVISMLDISLTLFMCVFVSYCTYRLSHDRVENILLLKFVRFANAMMCALIPLLFITEDFMRFERYAFALALCAFAGMPSLRHRHVLFSCKAFLLLICIVFCWMYAMRGTTFDVVIAPLLSYEYFPKLFL